MKWMEVIKLQVAEKNQEYVEQKIMKILNEIGGSGIKKELRIYHNALVNSDLCVQLHWESQKAEFHGSATGLCMVHVFKELALVSHSVWIEEE
jgi:hypothetical protein